MPRRSGPAAADAAGDEIERVVPADPPEAAVAAAPHHRVREPAELAQFPALHRSQRFDVGERLVGDRARGVDLQQLEARRAEVHAADGPVVEAGDAERAPVAHALRQDAPRPREVAPVLPHDPGDVAVVVRLLLPDAVRLPPDPQVAPQALRTVDEIACWRFLASRAALSRLSASMSMRSGCVYTLKCSSRRNPTTVWPKRSAAATARLDGADTAHNTGIPATAAFWTSSNDSRPDTSSTSFASGSDRSSTAAPTSLSSALCRPTSSRTATRSPVGREPRRRVQPAGLRRTDAGARPGGRAAHAATDAATTGPSLDRRAANFDLVERRLAADTARRTSARNRRVAMSPVTGRRSRTVTTLYSLLSGRRRGSTRSCRCRRRRRRVLRCGRSRPRARSRCRACAS